MSQFNFVDIKGARYCRNIEPEECPVCHFSVKPEELEWTLASIENDPNALLESVFKCPRHECGHLFIARYKRDDTPNMTDLGFPGLREFKYSESVPATAEIPFLPKEIIDISPLFVEVYTQALAAESIGLDQLSGVGLRKALEFLIKDYCIKMHPTKKIEIISSFLNNCIKVYVDNPQVKIVAERAVWLGNDETHYERRWNNKDINNLKELILLTINWIHSCILTSKYEDEMK